MARPEKDKYEKHRRNVMVRLTEEQYELVESNAKRMGVTVAEYGRQQMVFGKVGVRYSISIPIEDAREITRLLANATANLNQIAKYFNMGGLRSKEVQEQINAAVESIFDIRRMVKEMTDDEKNGKVLRDASGNRILRKEYWINGINCDPFLFDAECTRLNNVFHKNQKKEEIKSHITF